ncbi:MAG: Uma2 family endonuclease, partial [Gemmatimonadota bacterium]
IKRERYAHYGVPEYWVVDPDARRIEVHRPAEDPERRRVIDDALVWRPVPGGPELEISVPDALRGFAE